MNVPNENNTQMEEENKMLYESNANNSALGMTIDALDHRFSLPEENKGTCCLIVDQIERA
jgi:hypothetical protein